MDIEELKAILKRLINEASVVAPSITCVGQGTVMYGTVTDENLNHDALVTWEVEARAILTQLAQLSSLFADLRKDYIKKEEASRTYHSRSVFVHQTQQLLAGALVLFDSLLLKSTTPDSCCDQGARYDPGYAFIAMPMDSEDLHSLTSSMH